MNNIQINNLSFDEALDQQALDAINGGWGVSWAKKTYRKAKRLAKKGYGYAKKGYGYAMKYTYIGKGLDYKRRGEVYAGGKIAAFMGWLT